MGKGVDRNDAHSRPLTLCAEGEGLFCGKASYRTGDDTVLDFGGNVLLHPQPLPGVLLRLSQDITYQPPRIEVAPTLQCHLERSREISALPITE
jgi:hypothetical protein